MFQAHNSFCGWHIQLRTSGAPGRARGSRTWRGQASEHARELAGHGQTKPCLSRLPRQKECERRHGQVARRQQRLTLSRACLAALWRRLHSSRLRQNCAPPAALRVPCDTTHIKLVKHISVRPLKPSVTIFLQREHGWRGRRSDGFAAIARAPPSSTARLLRKAADQKCKARACPLHGVKRAPWRAQPGQQGWR